MYFHPGFLLKGFITGIAIAAPVGPTTVLVIHRTIKQDFKNGIKSGLGAATADALYGFMAAFGVTFITRYVYIHQIAFKLVGGCFLLFWGTKILTSRFAESHPLIKGKGKGGPFVSTLLLTLTNPMTLLAFMAVLAGLGGSHIRQHYKILFAWIIGLGCGSFFWWLALSKTADFLRERFNDSIIKWMNRFTGAIIIVAGALVILDILK